MSESNPPRVALVGGAHIHAPGFIKRLLARTDIAIKSIWDRDPAYANRRFAELGAEYPAKHGTRIVGDVEQIFSDPEIAAVVICSETNGHEPLVRAAVKNKKHLFVEKPLGFSASDANTMADLIEPSGLIFQTGYFMRSGAIFQFMQQQVQAGTFGKITRVRASNCHAGALNGWFDTEWRWMADPSQAGCGAFGDLGTHVLDMMLWMFGKVESCACTLDMGTARYPHCDETGEALLRFSNGPIATLAAAWDDLADPSPFMISGTEGHAFVFQGKVYFKSKRVEGADGKEPWTKLPEAAPHAFELFLDAVVGKQPAIPLVKPREAAYRNTVMETLYTAAAQKAWVML